MIRGALEQGAALALRSVFAPGVLASRWLERWRRPHVAEVPVAAPSFGLAAKAVLDEVFFLSETLSARFVSVFDRERIALEVSEAVDLYAARGWLDAPASFHPTPPALEMPRLARARSRGLEYTHLAFASGYEPHAGEPGRERWLGYDANRTAHAWLLRHPGPERPWLVCIHAYRMGFPLADFLAFPAAWFHRELGMNVAFPVLPLHGPRKAGWRTGDGFVSGDFLDTVHMHAQAMWDIRRLLGWLRAEGAPRVGVYGLSLGGYTASLLAGLEAELDCLVAGVPPSCYVSLARWNVPWPVLAIAEQIGLAHWDRLEALLRVISPLALAPRVPRDRLYLYAAMADRLVPPESALRLWRHWGEPRIAWYPGSHVSFGWQPEVRALLQEALVDSGLVRRTT
jgi:hypothetical protein